MGGSSNTTNTNTNTSGAGGKEKDSDSPAAFMEGDRVLAYHGPLLYEAKVQKTENRENEWRYFVHFLGWNKNWDEWVASDRLLKLTGENVRKQQELRKNQTVDKNIKSGRSTQHRPKGSNADAKADKEDTKGLVKGKKRKNQLGTEEKERNPSESLLMSQFPLTLKKQLVDDWEFVTQLGKSTGLVGYTSGTLGVQSPSLSKLEKKTQLTKKKAKSTMAPAKKGPRLREGSAENSPVVSIGGTPPVSAAGELIVLAQAASTQADIQSSSLVVLPTPQPMPVPQLAPPAEDLTNLSDLLGFTLDELVDPEIMATDDCSADIRKIQEVSKEASAAVTSAPGMKERLNRLFDEVTRPEADLLANTQTLRDAMAAVEADLPPKALGALLEVCHLDDKRAEVESAKSRIAQREAQGAHRLALDKTVADAKAMKKKYDQDTAVLLSAKSDIQKLQKTKKLLEEELAKTCKQLAKRQDQLATTSSSLSAQKQEVRLVLDKVTQLSAKVVPVHGNAKEDQQIVDGVQETIAKAAAALLALGARLPGSGLL